MQPYSQFGSAYLVRGCSLITTKGLKRFVIVTMLVNLLLFAIAFTWLLGQIETWMVDIMAWLPAYFQWLEYLIWPLLVISILLSFIMLFSTLTNWIAAPFNGLLAEKVERHLTGQSLGDEGLLSIMKDIPRTLFREAQKLAYYIPRAIGFLLIFFLLPGIGQIIWLMFTAWMMAIQYLDYAFDNHKISFQRMRKELAAKKGRAFSFGLLVALCAMIPFVNLLIMPLAICGGTALWVDHYRQDTLADHTL